VGRAAGYANTATLLQPLDPLHPESVLDSLNRFYRYGSGDTMGEMSLFSGWPTPNLRPHGWYLIGHPPLHLLPADATAPPPPPELTIEPVTDAAGLRSFETTIIQGYPFPELAAMGAGAMLGEGVLADPRFRLFVGRVGDQPVSAAGAFVEHGLSNVIIVATTPAARRRGYGEALTWRAALAEPGLPAMLLSSDDGRPVYERMGFMPLFRCTLWYRQRTG
jgi:GNAT superfamily N-acetyltransferase